MVAACLGLMMLSGSVGVDGQSVAGRRAAIPGETANSVDARQLAKISAPGETANSVDARQLAKISARMRSFVERGRVAGMVTLIAHRGKVIHHQAVGVLDLDAARPMDQDALFHIASMTKPITALAVMTLVDDGLVALTDPVARHLPVFGDVKLRVKAAEAAVGSGLEELRAPARPITIQDLLTHTSGMRGAYPEPLKDLFMAR
ncbi:MAG: class A beta-lactamase-related serine hydrolase, partial [Acidobacteria bacterium]|nr:class A beta-lactamase-related serine hydrolase [Acidobacteriota bacterium]